MSLLFHQHLLSSILLVGRLLCAFLSICSELKRCLDQKLDSEVTNMKLIRKGLPWMAYGAQHLEGMATTSQARSWLHVRY